MKVSYGNQPAPTTDIPENSSEPVVKNMAPLGGGTGGTGGTSGAQGDDQGSTGDQATSTGDDKKPPLGGLPGGFPGGLPGGPGRSAVSPPVRVPPLPPKKP